MNPHAYISNPALRTLCIPFPPFKPQASCITYMVHSTMTGLKPDPLYNGFSLVPYCSLIPFPWVHQATLYLGIGLHSCDPVSLLPWHEPCAPGDSTFRWPISAPLVGVKETQPPLDTSLTWLFAGEALIWNMPLSCRGIPEFASRKKCRFLETMPNKLCLVYENVWCNDPSKNFLTPANPIMKKLSLFSYMKTVFIAQY